MEARRTISKDSKGGRVRRPAAVRGELVATHVVIGGESSDGVEELQIITHVVIGGESSDGVEELLEERDGLGQVGGVGERDLDQGGGGEVGQAAGGDVVLDVIHLAELRGHTRMAHQSVLVRVSGSGGYYQFVFNSSFITFIVIHTYLCDCRKLYIYSFMHALKM